MTDWVTTICRCGLRLTLVDGWLAVWLLVGGLVVQAVVAASLEA